MACPVGFLLMVEQTTFSALSCSGMDIVNLVTFAPQWSYLIITNMKFRSKHSDSKRVWDQVFSEIMVDRLV